ncbi:MAG: sulfatase [Candidatus Binatia bacterium]
MSPSCAPLPVPRRARCAASVVAALLALAGAAGCRGTGGAGDAPPTGAIVVVVDALRADHLGTYGYERATSPRLDAFARDAMRFDSALTPAPWTLPAMGTLWTSLYPSVHGAVRRSDEITYILDRAKFRPTGVLAEAHVTLAEVLREHGFATAAFIDGCYPGKVFGFGQGFDLLVEDDLYGARLNGEALLAWLDATRPKRFFAYLHVIEVHSPYTPPGVPIELQGRDDEATRRVLRVLEEERQRYAQWNFDPDYTGTIDGSEPTLEPLRTAAPPPRDAAHVAALYDRGIAYTDYWLGHLIDELKRRGLYDQTVLVVTADHGEELFDHGRLDHSRTFYEEIMRIPLIMRVPGRGIGRTSKTQVGLIDVMPTLLDVLGVPYTGTMQGKSLGPLLDGAPFPDRVFFGEADQGYRLVAMRTNQMKYVQDLNGHNREAYDLVKDPEERKNICTISPTMCAPFATTVSQWRAEMAQAKAALQVGPAPTAVIDAQTRERLKALGYDP